LHKGQVFVCYKKNKQTTIDQYMLSNSFSCI